MNSKHSSQVKSLHWTGHSLKVLDQRKLPDTISYDEYNDAKGVCHAIQSMQVRGAPAIGIAAAYGVVLSMQQHYETSTDWHEKVAADCVLLAQSRPTAVNLFWALSQMQNAFSHSHLSPLAAAIACAERIHADDIAANYRMGELGANLLQNAKGVMTHCNTGALATGGYGTALGVIRSAVARNSALKIYAGETRPWLQGTRLTVWELAQEGIACTLIADSAAAWLMKSKAIDWIIVGADRIAANGDTANKIGTYSLSVLARQHGVKVMVVAPTSTIDWNTPTGQAIEIELRHESELLPTCYADSHVSAWNPVFDVTPAKLITAIVTEQGVILNPNSDTMKKFHHAL